MTVWRDAGARGGGGAGLREGAAGEGQALVVGQVQEGREQAEEGWGEERRREGEGHGGWGGMSYSYRVQYGGLEVKGKKGRGRRVEE